MKKLIGLLAGILVMMGCGGCLYYIVTWGSEEKDTSYNIIVSSDDASDITIYLPYPYYKGKPDKRYLQWLRENLDKNYLKADASWYRDEYKESWKVARNIKLDLIDTEYGKMLYIYIPKLSPAERIFGQVYFETSDRPLKTNPKTMFDDYKLTYEDKIKPEMEWIDPKYETHRVKILNMPFYVQFKGKGLNVDFTYGNFWYVVPYVSIASLSYRQGSLENPLRLGPDFFTFTQSGWHWMPIKKEQGGGK